MKACRPKVLKVKPLRDFGYRVIVDEACGCAEEHVLVCCGQPMNEKKA